MKKFTLVLSMVFFLTNIVLPVISVSATELTNGSVYEENQQNDVQDNILDGENIEENQQSNINEDENVQEEVKEETSVTEEAQEEQNEDITSQEVQEVQEVQEDNTRYEKSYSISAYSIASSCENHEHEHDYECEYEKEEFKLKEQGLSDYYTLQNKTNDKYEVALAYSDGSYSFVDSANSYDEAMTIVENTPAPASDDSVLPVILNENGQVIYSTNAMIKFLQTVDGQAHFNHLDSCYEIVNGVKQVRSTHPSVTTNLYTDSSLKTAFTYVNQGYVDDAPAIEINDQAAKIQVSGYTGWIKNNYTEQASDKTYNWTDFVVIPLNQVKNPSYYYVENGILYHSISYDLEAELNENRSKLQIGVAPSYLKANNIYLSYDGNYFYDGNNIQNGLNNIINDLRADNKNNSINKSNPYYSYYQNLSFRSKTVYSAADLDKFINANTEAKSKLRGIGQALKNAESNYGVNALLTLSVAINESGWGMSDIAQTKNNIFGLNAVDSNPGLAANEFPSIESCINDFAKNWISKGYTNPEDYRSYGGHVGNKYRGVNVKYASDPFWGEKATQHALTIDKELSGGINSLKDTNNYQLGIYDSTNVVYNSSLKELYKVDNYWSYTGTPIVFSKNDPVTISGQKYYEINPERNQNTPLPDKTYAGNYDWNIKGYINTSGVRIINTANNNTNPNPDPDPNPNPDTTKAVTYATHVQDIGWQAWKKNGETSGTSGQAKRLEAIKIKLQNYPGASIKYSTHIEDIGWQAWKYDGEISGTEGQSKRLEGIKIEATGLPSNMELQYRVHVQNEGWQEWKSNGQVAGTEGKSLRLEAIEIRIVEQPLVVSYKTHVQDYGWQSFVSNGATSGTEGQSKRLEGIVIETSGLPSGASIRYRTHVQDIGWESTWKTAGQVSGTQGKSKRLEAIQIELVNAPGYHIEYRTHIQDIGWESTWKRDGQTSGTEGKSKRLEGIQIRIVKD